ncbi:MAG TPA: DUF1579 domain-containing protein [Patescibacteria group bacterium]|nr:DUF1579 domain-containing protein [Patescibacteria group bacterium]
MTKCRWMLCRLVLCGILGCCVAGTAMAIAAPAETKAKSAKAAPAKMTDEQMMAEMMKLGTPGPNHEMLKKFVGSWKTVTKMWMGPGEPQSSDGSAEYSMILGGRLLKDEYKGTFMGGPFEGFGLTGYDNKKGRFITVWGDTMMTGLIEVDGTYNAATREMTFKGMMNMVGPPTPYRMVTKFVDDNHFVFSWYERREGKETKTMEIDYTRQ